MSLTPAYDQLRQLFSRISVLSGAESMLHWDMSVMMPEGGAAARAKQLALLASLRHEILTKEDTRWLIEQAEQEGLKIWEKANLMEMRREWMHAATVPTELVEAISRASSECEITWRKARASASFSRVSPQLEELVRLTAQLAEIKSQALGIEPYDALLDQYEPDMRMATIDVVFGDLEAFLPDFIGKAIARQKPALPQTDGVFSPKRQKALSLEIMRIMGFDFNRGRLDESLHPFCGGIPEDTRITTRYDDRNFLKSLYGVIHETGHALYEQGLPIERLDQPVGRSRSMGVHESQSLLMEMQACRTPEFISFLALLLPDYFAENDCRTPPEWHPEVLKREILRIKPGFIRVDADEASYPLHVILRYRLEKAMIAGDLAVRDLPAAWNEGFTRLFGFTPTDDAVGCLQDIHWYDGAIGYFPSYTLGAIMAAQFYQAALDQYPEIEEAIGEGDFSILVEWLNSNVYSIGSSLSTREILVKATGRGLDAGAFIKHLKKRYLDQ